MIEIFEDKAGEWRFRVKALNGEIVASSEGYTRETDAIRGAERLIDLMRSVSDRDITRADR